MATIEEVSQEPYYTGPKGAHAFWFELDLMNIPHEATLRIHDQAMRHLIDLGHGPRGEVRPLVRNALQAIAHLTELRLSRPFGQADVTQWVVQAVYDPEDDDEIIKGDVARLRTVAMEHADDPDAAIAVVWGAVSDGAREGPRTGP